MNPLKEEANSPPQIPNNGTRTYSSGMKYVGNWKDGCEHGHGTRTYSDGNEIKGCLEDGELVGQQFELNEGSHP